MSRPTAQVSEDPLRVRTRRKSSILGGDPRGDTGATAMATTRLTSPQAPPDSPTDTAKPSLGKPQRERKRTKAKKLLRRWKRASLKHTWLTPLILIALMLGAYLISPGEHNPLRPFIFLSYANPPLDERATTLPAFVGNSTQYGKGPKDLAFVFFYTIVLSFCREFFMQRLIRPIAIACHMRTRTRQARFMEQFYTAMYFAVFGPLGVYVMSRTPVWYFNVEGMYAGFPHRAHEAAFKAYYLLEASYWLQQGLVLLLQLEKPRKDFRELVVHHVITLSLIALSYRFHFTYIGLAVFLTHDISDFFLATSKLLGYMDAFITPAYFTMFVAIWAYLRHYINLKMVASILPPATFTLYGRQFSTGQFLTVGPYTYSWFTFENGQYKGLLSNTVAFVFLGMLQSINLFWFSLLMRIFYRTIFVGVTEDVRSDDEADEEAEVVEDHANGRLSKPQVLLNGKPLANGSLASGADVDVSDSVRRSPRKR